MWFYLFKRSAFGNIFWKPDFTILGKNKKIRIRNNIIIFIVPYYKNILNNYIIKPIKLISRVNRSFRETGTIILKKNLFIEEEEITLKYDHASLLVKVSGSKMAVQSRLFSWLIKKRLIVIN